MAGSAAPKGVLFDLDGTLIDSLADLGDAVNRMLEDQGWPTHPIEAYRDFIGDGVRKLVEKALPESVRGDARLFEQALAQYQSHYAEGWNRRTCVYEGIPSLLDRLATAGIPIGVISNKPHRFTTLSVAHFFPNVPFSIVWGQREGVARKPDPEAASQAAGEWQLPISQLGYIGDSGVDMGFARAAGMKAIGVAWGFRPTEELIQSGADCVVESVEELVALLLGGDLQRS